MFRFARVRGDPRYFWQDSRPRLSGGILSLRKGQDSRGRLSLHNPISGEQCGKRFLAGGEHGAHLLGDEEIVGERAQRAESYFVIDYVSN